MLVRIRCDAEHIGCYTVHDRNICGGDSVRCSFQKLISTKGKQEKEQLEIADPRQDLFCVVWCLCCLVWCTLCVVCVPVCFIVNKQHNKNCHFRTADSDDRVPRRPTLIGHQTLTHDVFY